MTVEFKRKHAEVAQMLTNVPGWKHIETLDNYVTQYRRCNRKPTMALLKRTSEHCELQRHVYDAKGFLSFLRQVVVASSRVGICMR